VVRGSRVRYEAERGVLNHAVVRTGASGASQGAVVANIDFADSWVDSSVFAPVAGAYTVHIGYAAGNGDAQHTLTVNGGAPQTVNYPNRGWDNWTQVAAGVSLNACWNTLRFQHRTRWAELDYVEVA
jgi:arabinan endo-1,5-alpha-L-arabinosidase